MKKSKFIILVLLHFIFFIFAFLIYVIQSFIGNILMADSIANAYAATLFIPNMIALAAAYLIYAFWFLRRMVKKESIENLKFNIFYNFFFLFGVAIIMLNPKDTFFCDTVFIISQLLAIFFAVLLIIKTKNKNWYAGRIF